MLHIVRNVFTCKNILKKRNKNIPDKLMQKGISLTWKNASEAKCDDQ